MKKKENKTETENKFNQLCVWPGTLLGEDTPEMFEEWMLNEKGLHAKIKFMEEVRTLPGDGGEGGRNDLFFYVHDDDLEHFSVPRILYGIKWWEDVLNNMKDSIYPKEIIDKYPRTW